MTERQYADASGAAPEQRLPGRAAHLAKIANAVRPIEYAADAPGRSAGPSANGAGRANAPHHDVGRGS